MTFRKFAAPALTLLVAFIINCWADDEGSSCRMKTGELGICTKLPECKTIDEALKRRKFPFKNLVICSFIDKIEVICCTDNVGTASTADPSLIILKQGDSLDISSSNSPEQLPTVNVEKFVTVGNIHLTDEEEYIDLAKIGKRVFEESSRQTRRPTHVSPISFGTLTSRSLSTTKRPSAKVRDLKVNDATTSWTSTSTTPRSTRLTAVRDLEFVYSAADSNSNGIYSSNSYQNYSSGNPSWNNRNWRHKSEKLVQQSTSTSKPRPLPGRYSHDQDRIFWDDESDEIVSKRPTTRRPFSRVGGHRPSSSNIVFPSTYGERTSSEKVVWPDSTRITSATAISRLKPTHVWSSTERMLTSLRTSPKIPDRNSPSSRFVSTSQPLSGSSSSASVLDDWMVNILLEASSSLATSAIPSSPVTFTLPSFVGLPNSPEDNNVNSPSTTPRTKDPNSLTPGSRASDRKADKVCTQYEKDFTKIPKPLDFHILDGEPAFLGEFPHMAALGYPGERNGQAVIDFRCGGSLISNRHVMTAAHCVRRREDLPTIIRLGSIYLDEPGSEAMDVGVAEVILNPAYMSRFQYHDIALILLNITLPLDTVYIYPACLHTDRRDIEANLQLVAAGWGWTSISKREQSNQLLKANLSTVNLAECNQKHLEYEENRQIPNGLNDGQLCALDPNLEKDTCPGDSGGPLQTILESKLSRVYGITSFGALCGSAIPSVYARVSFYLDWLESVVWPNTA